MTVDPQAVIMEIASRRLFDAELVANRLGVTRQAATVILRQLVREGRLEESRRTTVSWRSGASLGGYQVGRVMYRAPKGSR